MTKSIIPKINKLLISVAFITFTAMLVTAQLTYMHYEPGSTGFCTFNETINCDIVNQSQWSVMDLGFVEIPVAVLGFLTYTILFIVSIGLVKNWNFQKIHKSLRPGIVLMLVRWLAVTGFIYSLYLTYIEAFVLKAFCILCVTQQVLIFAIMILFFVMKSAIDKNKKTSKVCEFC